MPSRDSEHQATERRRWQPTIGQWLCIFALGVGIVMVVAAIRQASNVNPMDRLAGRWECPMYGASLTLSADGTAVYERYRKRSRLRWSYGSDKITIAWPDGSRVFPVTAGSPVRDHEFHTDSGATFEYRWSSSL